MATKLTKSQKATEKAEAIKALREMLKPGDTVFCSLKKRSASGMCRCIDFRIFRGDIRNPHSDWLSYRIAKALGYTFDEKTEAVKVKGCGMDMGFHVVDSLSYALFADGGKLESRWI